MPIGHFDERGRMVIDGVVQDTADDHDRLAEAAAMVGGEGKLRAMLAEGGREMSGPEIADFNARVSDPARFRGAVTDLAKRVGGPITSAADLTETMRAIRRGDEAATARLDATPAEQIEKFVNQ